MLPIISVPLAHFSHVLAEDRRFQVLGSYKFWGSARERSFRIRTERDAAVYHYPDKTSKHLHTKMAKPFPC